MSCRMNLGLRFVAQVMALVQAALVANRKVLIDIHRRSGRWCCRKSRMLSNSYQDANSHRLCRRSQHRMSRQSLVSP